jgi:peptidyl-prolyl cis-trans isomerase A (cyclophilin A)
MDNKYHFILAIAVLFAVIGSGIYYSQNKTAGNTAMEKTSQTPPKTEPIQQQAINNTKNMNTITLETSMGNIVFETYNNDAPKTVENFITLAKKGFYDGIIFHRVIDGFMIQGGDPTGTGTGGPGYSFADELNPNTDSYKAGYKKGVVAMANAGPNTNGSQFFIMLEDYPLPNSYSIFGKVVSGQETVDAIGKVKTGANDKPVTPVVIKKVTVE